MNTNFIWLGLALSPMSSEGIVAILGAISALFVALGTLVTTIVSQYKIWTELKRNTRVSEVAAISSVATHEIVHEGVTNDGSASGPTRVPSSMDANDGGNRPG